MQSCSIFLIKLVNLVKWSTSVSVEKVFCGPKIYCLLYLHVFSYLLVLSFILVCLVTCMYCLLYLHVLTFVLACLMFYTCLSGGFQPFSHQTFSGVFWVGVGALWVVWLFSGGGVGVIRVGVGVSGWV